MKSLSACEVYGMRLAPAGPTALWLCSGPKTVPGRIDALVMGEHLYEVCIRPPRMKRCLPGCARCAGQIGSWIDLLKGNLSPELLEILCAPEGGLFPAPEEWRFSCSCPDWADLCKHAAAILYAFGVMLDKQPELLFTLRGMDSSVLIPKAPEPVPGGEDALDVDAGSLSDIFGISLD
ncbi:MAG: SWIM zinc finger family protein [Akkermansia muciniphila]